MADGSEDRMRGWEAPGGGAGCPVGRWQGLRAGHGSGDGGRRQTPEMAGVGRQTEGLGGG